MAGTRRGKVLGLDLEGRQLFVAGDKDADEKTGGWQSRFGAIGAIAISPKIEFIVVGGEKETVAMDPQGQQLWASTALRRITSMAIGLNESQNTALGSRDGFVACVGKDGAVK